LIWRQNASGQGPRGRLIFTEVIASLASLLSLVWLIPFTWSMLHYPLDLLIAAGWFASFGALMQWISQENLTCDGVFGLWFWDGNTHDYYCGEYKVLEGFALISGALWLMSAFVVSYIFRYLNSGTYEADEYLECARLS
jgi:hypothetical protein